jgi:hypothetical protein
MGIRNIKFLIQLKSAFSSNDVSLGFDCRRSRFSLFALISCSLVFVSCEDKERTRRERAEIQDFIAKRDEEEARALKKREDLADSLFEVDDKKYMYEGAPDNVKLWIDNFKRKKFLIRGDSVVFGWDRNIPAEVKNMDLRVLERKFELTEADRLNGVNRDDFIIFFRGGPSRRALVNYEEMELEGEWRDFSEAKWCKWEDQYLYIVIFLKLGNSGLEFEYSGGSELVDIEECKIPD